MDIKKDASIKMPQGLVKIKSLIRLKGSLASIAYAYRTAKGLGFQDDFLDDLEDTFKKVSDDLKKLESS